MNRGPLAAFCILALILSGCVASAPRTRTIPLNVPPARDLVLALADLPQGYARTTTSGASWNDPRFVDGARSHFIENASGEDRREVDSVALAFETSDAAHDTFASIVANAYMSNATKSSPSWGDEASLLQSENMDVATLRNGTVVWVATVMANGVAPDVPIQDVVRLLLAKA